MVLVQIVKVRRLANRLESKHQAGNSAVVALVSG